MKNFIFILGFLVLSLPVSASRHCKEKYRTYAEQIARLDPSFDFDLVNLEFFSGGSIVAGYEYEVEPAHTKGLYTRTDRWLISTKAIPSRGINLGEDVDASVSLGLRHHTEATFIRFMNDPCHAMLANPYSPRRIPLKADIAIGPKFKVGDYFLFRGSVGFVASAEILSLLGSGAWGAGFSGNFLMEGFYQLHIVRLNENQIRLKVVGHRGRTASASVGIGYENSFEVFQVSVLDNALERFVNTKPVKIQANVGHSNVFMVDYVLDLSDASVASAFESVMKKVKSFRNIELTAPFRSQDTIENNILLDLSPLEDLYRDDYSTGRNDRILRNLRATSGQNSYGGRISIGNKIIGFKIDGGGSTSKMSIFNPDDAVERYLLRSWDKKGETRFFYSWSKNKSETSLHALFSADKDFKNLVPVNIVHNIRQKKNRFTYRNFKQLQLKLKKALPLDIYHDIPWDKWPMKKSYFNYGLRYQLMMSAESILGAPELTRDEIRILFKDHILSKGLKPQDYFVDDTHGGFSAEDRFNSSLRSAAKHLSRALDKKRPMAQRLEMVTKLKFNKLFAESGMSFLMALSPDLMSKNYYLDLDISSNEADIDYSYGYSEMAGLYKKILTIKAALDDDAFDILREAESLSVRSLLL